MLVSAACAAVPAAASAASADIRSRLVYAPSVLETNDTATFLFRVTNAGPDAASGDTTYVRAGSTGRSTFSHTGLSSEPSRPCSFAGSALCDLGNMGVDQSFLIKVRIKAFLLTGDTDAEFGGSLATGRTDLSDPNTGNDNIRVPFRIVEQDRRAPRLLSRSSDGPVGRLRVSEGSYLRGTLHPEVRGRRRGKRCRTRARRGRPCRTHGRNLGRVRRPLLRGNNTVDLPTRARGRDLRRGIYRLRFRLWDEASNKSRTYTLRYRIR